MQPEIFVPVLMEEIILCNIQQESLIESSPACLLKCSKIYAINSLLR